MKNFLKSLFGLNNIYERLYGNSFFWFPILYFVLIFMPFVWYEDVTGVDFEYFEQVIWLLIAVGVLFFVRALVKNIYVWHILRNRNNVSLSQLGQLISRGSWIDNSALQTAASSEAGGNKVTLSIKGFYNQSGVSMYDAIYTFYQKNKYGEYRARQGFYTVCDIQLTNHLPNLLFDSLRARGRQFKKYFTQSQRLYLEGNFDEYFETYGPKHYQIDALSFITPEVMQAMIEMSEYDIEINQNRLLVYAPLLDEAGIHRLRAKSKDLHTLLERSAKNYDDGRMAHNEDSTTSFGRKLLRSPRAYLGELGAAIAALLLFGGILLGGRDKDQALMPLILMISLLSLPALFIVYKMIRLDRINKTLERSFLKHYKK